MTLLSTFGPWSQFSVKYSSLLDEFLQVLSLTIHFLGLSFVFFTFPVQFLASSQRCYSVILSHYLKALKKYQLGTVKASTMREISLPRVTEISHLWNIHNPSAFLTLKWKEKLCNRYRYKIFLRIQRVDLKKNSSFHLRVNQLFIGTKNINSSSQTAFTHIDLLCSLNCTTEWNQFMLFNPHYDVCL